MDVDTVITAYARGAFPMDSRDAPGIELYLADPRAVLPLDGFRVPRTVARRLRSAGMECRIDTAFGRVVRGCAGSRAGGEWLTPRLVRLYDQMHAEGLAHSVEAWCGDELAGGLFGVAVGSLYTSESMFHTLPDGGNAALVFAWRHLRERGFTLWDIQMATDHTRRFGAVELPAGDYAGLLDAAVRRPASFDGRNPGVVVR